MPAKCKICADKKRELIDQALVNDEPLRVISRRFRVSEDALFRHKKKHIPEALAKAKHAETINHSTNLLDQIQGYLEKTDAILVAVNGGEDGKGRKDYPTAIKALKEVRGYLELLAKARGELEPEGQVNVQVNVQEQNLLVEIFMEALRSELKPEEAQRVVAYIKKRRDAIAIGPVIPQAG